MPCLSTQCCSIAFHTTPSLRHALLMDSVSNPLNATYRFSVSAQIVGRLFYRLAFLANLLHCEALLTNQFLLFSVKFRSLSQSFYAFAGRNYQFVAVLCRCFSLYTFPFLNVSRQRFPVAVLTLLHRISYLNRPHEAFRHCPIPCHLP